MMIKRDSSDDLEIRISLKRPISGAGERGLRDGEKNGAKLGQKYSGWSFHKRWRSKGFFVALSDFPYSLLASQGEHLKLISPLIAVAFYDQISSKV